MKQPPINDKHTYEIKDIEAFMKPPPLWLSKRLLVSIILFLSFVDFQIIRNNINIAVVEMTTNQTYIDGDIEITRVADFNWDTSTIGLIMSIISYGGLFSVFGGLLSDGIGGSVTCALSMMAAGILTILHPAILYLNFHAFLAVRFLTGLFEIFFYVSSVDVYSRWFPKKERSMLISFSFNGTNAGVALVYPLCGYIAHGWNWQMVFYVTGTISIIIAAISWILVKNKPIEDTWISKEELQYLMEETDHSIREMVDHPYKKIFTSIPLWNLCMILFVHIWLSTLIGSCLPLYVKDMTHAETDQIGIISSIPNTVYLIMFPVAGTLMDYWKNHSDITVTRIHKTMILIAYLSAGAFFVIAAITSNFTLTLILFVCTQIVTSSVPLIIEIININLAPDHCNVVSALSSFFFAFSAIIAQTVTGFMITNHSLQEWNNCFLLAAAIALIGSVLFAFYGSSETQPWSSISNEKQPLISKEIAT